MTVQYVNSRTDLHEVWQDAIPTPPWVSERLPCIKIIGATSIPAHRIQDASATKDLALGHWPGIAVKLCLGYSDKVPVIDPANISSNVDRILYYCFIMIPVEVSRHRNTKQEVLTRLRPLCRGRSCLLARTVGLSLPAR